MNTRSSILCVAAVLGGFTIGGLAVAKEEAVPLDQVPKAVLDAVQAKFAGAKLLAASKEDDDGKTIYEIELKHDGKQYDVSVSAAGRITEIERTIAVDDLPKPVVEAVRKKYPHSKVKKAEEISSGHEKLYEVVITTLDKKDLELKLDANGKFIEDEEDEDDDDDK